MHCIFLKAVQKQIIITFIFYKQCDKNNDICNLNIHSFHTFNQFKQMSVNVMHFQFNFFIN